MCIESASEIRAQQDDSRPRADGQGDALFGKRQDWSKYALGTGLFTSRDGRNGPRDLVVVR